MKVSTTKIWAIMLLAITSGQASAAIITGETATATSESVSSPNRAASNTVNNSGITINSADLVTNGQITHDNTLDNMWRTNDASAIGDQLTIDLHANYNLDGMRIWNFNESGQNDICITLYNLETSLDNSSWTTRQTNQSLALNDGTATYAGVYTAINWTNVRYLRLTIVDTNFPGDALGGLSEVMLSGSPVVEIPEPNSLLLLGIGSVFAYRRVRRGAKS
jgi:hypothetical protein